MRYQCLSPRAVLRAIFRRRSIKQDATLKTELDRCLTYPQLTMYVVASMMGAGIYVLTGTIIKNYAGAGSSVAYLLAAFGSIFTGACYCEFSTLIPRAGSAYVYTYLILGELPAFIIGWTMISDVVIGIAAVSKSFSGTVNIMSNYKLANWSETNLLHLQGEAFDKTPDITAFLFLFVLMMFTLTGTDMSMTFNLVCSSFQVIFLSIIIIAAFVLGLPNNLTDDGGFFPYGAEGFMSAASLTIFAFSGYEALANAAEETKNPKKDIPRALFTAFLMCTILYFLAALSMAYLIPRAEINLESPFPHGFLYIGQTGLMWFSAVSTIIAVGAAKIVTMFVVPRMIYAMASDGLLFKFLAYVHPKIKVPIWSLFIGGSVAMFMALLLNIKTLADFTSIGTIFCYHVIGVDLFILRYDYDDSKLSLASNATGGAEAQKIINENTDSKVRRVELRRYGYDLEKKWKGFSSSGTFRTLLVIYVVACLGFALSLKGLIILKVAWLLVFLSIFGLGVVVSFGLLSLYKPNIHEDVYETRLMPICPAVTIFTNSVLIVNLPTETWIRFIVWSLFGLFIYFTYGMWHSHVEDVGEDDPLPPYERMDDQAGPIEMKTMPQDVLNNEDVM